jgi:predicted membrane channel-forming protein YqfA (hemolysin III family)
MRRLSLISWVLIVVGLVFLAVGVIYFAYTAPDLPSFIPGHVDHVEHANHYTKRGVAGIAVAVLAFVGAFVASWKRPSRGAGQPPVVGAPEPPTLS